MSPVLTIIEKTTARTFASLFGLTGPHAGGTTEPGGSASNTTAVVVARNTMFPETKVHGWIGKRFVLFTSAHGHYSFEKAAQICGLGSANAWAVPVDARGRMQVSELLRLIRQAREEGLTPFFVNTTAGTTVFGAYDPPPRDCGGVQEGESLVPRRCVVGRRSDILGKAETQTMGLGVGG